MVLLVTTVLLTLNLTEGIQNDIDKYKFISHYKEKIEYPNFTYYENIPLDRDLQIHIHKLSEKYNIPETLVYSIISIESNFNPNATSPTQDYGLLQLNKSSGTLDWLANEIGLGKDFEWDNPYHSIEAGLWYLNYLKEYWINQGITNEEDLFYLITTSYNMGLSGARNYVRRTGTPVSRYSERVLDVKSKIDQNNFVHH